MIRAAGTWRITYMYLFPRQAVTTRNQIFTCPAIANGYHSSQKANPTQPNRAYLHLDVEDGPKLVNVGLAAGAAEDALVGEGMELGNVPAEDLVSTGQPGVGRNNGVVRAGDGEGGAAVELVRGEPTLVRGFRHTVVDMIGVRLTAMSMNTAVTVRSGIKCNWDATGAFGRVDGKGDLAVPGLDGLLGRHEGGHGGCLVWSLFGRNARYGQQLLGIPLPSSVWMEGW